MEDSLKLVNKINMYINTMYADEEPQAKELVIGMSIKEWRKLKKKKFYRKLMDYIKRRNRRQ